MRRFAWLHDNVSVLKTFLSQCVLRCHVDTVTGGGSSGAPQYQHPNIVSRGNRPAHVIPSAILSLRHLLKGDLWLGFELPTPYIPAVQPQRPLGWGGKATPRAILLCSSVRVQIPREGPPSTYIVDLNLCCGSRGPVYFHLRRRFNSRIQLLRTITLKVSGGYPGYLNTATKVSSEGETDRLT